MDSKAFEQIYIKYFDMLYRICFLYMKNEADALDIVQEVFEKILNEKVVFGKMQGISTDMDVAGEQHLKAWLIVTASNACKSQLRRWWNKKRNEYSDELENQLSMQERTEHSEILAEVLSLDDKYRLPVYLHYYEGSSTIAIGQMLRISPSTIRTRLAKARQVLKLSLEE